MRAYIRADLKAALEAEANKERRSMTAQLELVLEDRYLSDQRK